MVDDFKAQGNTIFVSSTLFSDIYLTWTGFKYEIFPPSWSMNKPNLVIPCLKKYVLFLCHEE